MHCCTKANLFKRFKVLNVVALQVPQNLKNVFAMMKMDIGPFSMKRKISVDYGNKNYFNQLNGMSSISVFYPRR